MAGSELKETYDNESYSSDFAPKKSIYQDDSRLFHRAGHEYEWITSVDLLSATGRKLTFQATTVSGQIFQLLITGYDNGILRIQLLDKTMVADETSPMLVSSPNESVSIKVKTNDELTITCTFQDYVLTISKSPFDFVITRTDGKIIMKLETEKIAGKFVSPPLGFRKSKYESCSFMSWEIHNDEQFFGLGEKWNKVEKTSTHATIWASDTCGSNTTDMSYKSIPVLFSTKGWGLMVHSSYRSKWEIGSFSYTSGAFLCEDPKCDLFLFLAPTLKGLIQRYTSLTGRPSMPPRWAFGVWMSRCQYENRKQVDEVIDRLRKEEIPCDVIHLDPMWMNTHYYHAIGVDACDFVRNDIGYPDQPAMFAEFLSKGFNTCLWINPYIPEGSNVYEEAKKNGYLLLSTDGTIARLEHGNPVGMVDFTNPDAKEWWKGYLVKLLRDGASVLKPDYGDRIPETALFHNGRTGKEMHNMYLHLYSETAYEAAKEVYGTGIVWRRSGYIGSQRYPGTWAGDTQIHWSGMRCCLRGGLSASCTGESFWSHDIGGFVGPQPDEELYSRWAQFGLLSPLSRFHGTTPREPWHFGETALKVVRHYAQLRYQLLPYWFAVAHESVTSGIPIMRHMALEFPNEPNVHTLDEQFMIGPDILVAPILVEGARTKTIYFPHGIWYGLEDTSVRIDGGRFVTVDAPLERIPIFVRGGAIIPRYSNQLQHLKEPLPSTIRLEVYPEETAQKSLHINEGGRMVSIDAEINTQKGVISIQPAPVSVHIRLVGCSDGTFTHKGTAISKMNDAGEPECTIDAINGARIHFDC